MNTQKGSEKGWSGRGKLADMVAELERQTETKADFVADTRSLEVKPAKEGQRPGLVLHAKEERAREWLGREGAPIKESALMQLGQKQEPEIPTQFIKRLAEVRPQRAAELLNGLMQDGPKRRFVRCLDGNVRAVLSDRYRTLDHYDVAFAALDAVRQAGGAVIECALSDSHMRIKFTTAKLWDVIQQSRKEGKSIPRGSMGNAEHLRRLGFDMGGELPGGGGTVYPLGVVSNSETGHGGFDASIGLFEGACANGIIFESALGRVHLGEKLRLGLYSAATLSAEAKAIYLKARDIIAGSLTKETFEKLITAAKGAQGDQIKAPQSAVENIAKAAGLSDQGKEAVLAYFLRDYDMTRLGLGQAVARYAQDGAEPEEAASLEELAGRIVREPVLVGAGVR